MEACAKMLHIQFGLKKCSETQHSKGYSEDKDFCRSAKLLFIHALTAFLNGYALLATPGSTPCEQGGSCVCRSKRDTIG